MGLTHTHIVCEYVYFGLHQSRWVLFHSLCLAVYMMNNVHMWKNHPVLDGELSWKEAGGPPKAKMTAQSSEYGPVDGGMTFELCAGIVDKSLPLEQIVHEEILEETGYNVPLKNIEYITMYNSSVGVSGTTQWLYYAEVTDGMLMEKGGGCEEDQEMIEVIYIPLKDIDKFVFDSTKPKTSGLCFAFFWFNRYKEPHLNKTMK